MKIPLLTYPLTREINSPWLALGVYASMILATVVLIGLNIVLTGYEIILTPTSNFNATQELWFHRLTKTTPKPGSLCGAYNFTVGDQLTTTTNLFRYTLIGVNNGLSALAYSGASLENCDVISGSLDGDMTVGVLDVTLYLGCLQKGLPIVVKAEHSESWFAYLSTYPETRTVKTFFQNDQQNGVAGWGKGTPVYLLLRSMTVATFVIQHLRLFVANSIANPSDWPLKLSIEIFPTCTISPYWSSFKDQHCQTDSDTSPVTWVYNWNLAYLLFGNGTEVAAAPTRENSTGPNYISIDSRYDTPTANYSQLLLPFLTDAVQLFANAVRLDWGIIHPNNVFLNLDMVNRTISNELVRDFVYGAVKESQDGDSYGMSAFGEGRKPARLTAQYLCRFKFPVGWARGILNVTVATFSILSAVWAAVMLIIAFLARRRTKDNDYSGPPRVDLYSSGGNQDMAYSQPLLYHR